MNIENLEESLQSAEFARRALLDAVHGGSALDGLAARHAMVAAMDLVNTLAALIYACKSVE